MPRWQEEYLKKTITPDEAAALVNSGDRVVIPATSDPLSLEMALIARKEDLHDVEVQIGTGLRDLPWYDPSWRDSFKVYVWHVLEPNVRRMINEEHGGDVYPLVPRFFSKAETQKQRTGKTIVFTEVSPPDEHGYCCFGPVLWDKKDKILSADVAIVEIRPELIRTHGDNFIHVSDIDYFVPTDYPPTDLYPPIDPEPHVAPIANNISDLIRDGDTLQVGVGSATEGLIMAGLVETRRDLGWHTERIPRGCLKQMKDNPEIFSGRRKNLNPGKSIVTAVALTNQEDADFVNNNPTFEFRGPDYVHDICVIAAHNNMVAINNALQVDLTGQVCVEAIGPHVYGGIGGQFEFVVGAGLSKGGRSITVLPATASGGRVSRIVSRLPLGSYVSIPRTVVHYVATEYGRACLMGKSQRDRVNEMINIAHPDFRADLRKEAERLF